MGWLFCSIGRGIIFGLFLFFFVLFRNFFIYLMYNKEQNNRTYELTEIIRKRISKVNIPV